MSLIHGARPGTPQRTLWINSRTMKGCRRLSFLAVVFVLLLGFPHHVVSATGPQTVVAM